MILLTDNAKCIMSFRLCQVARQIRILFPCLNELRIYLRTHLQNIEDRIVSIAGTISGSSAASSPLNGFGVSSLSEGRYLVYLAVIVNTECPFSRR